MKYYSKSKQFKNSTGTCTFFPDQNLGYSYGWWEVSKEICGVLVYNDYFYSSTTSKHQSNIRRLLSRSPELIISAPNGLQDLDAAIKYHINEIDKLQKEIDKPRSRKATNQRRNAEQQSHRWKIEAIERLQALSKNAA